MKHALIAQYMTDYPISIDADALLADADALMQANGFRHLPVLHEGEPMGIVSDRDLKLARSLPGVDLHTTRVSEIAKTELYTVPATATLSEVTKVMAERRIGSAVIVEDHKVIGIFTTTDALFALSVFSEGASKG